jgi:hypothetical protein
VNYDPDSIHRVAIVGLNLSLLVTFLAWRFFGPGKPYPDRDFDTVTNKDIPTGK